MYLKKVPTQWQAITIKNLRMNYLRPFLIVLITFFVLIQLYRPVRNNSQSNGEKTLNQIYPVPKEVSQILSKACYDCHSNKTNYPWYANIQPVGWYISQHISEGKQELNFDEFGYYSIKRQKNKFKAIASQIEDNAMPLASYSRIHPEAELTKAEKELIVKWARSMSDSIQSFK
jgi:hypothetical protein